ncbi:hypothetical protein [Flavobacterium dankookense]|uniref:Uncharacterized protein n=1 Tax=Flavobacterium dankookense TaxID=706186 RepID=A0A4R6Q8A1_9FLAO|nr:hypothetical protein [Flavobacterium dankookense]TDP57379.1 hypothetical protein BC748_2899 [Flavobacterium dankookense]
MNPQELIGRTLTNIFETKPSLVQEGIPGPASYFDIVIEIDGSDLFELGAHEILDWTKKDKLTSYEKSAWEVQNNFNVIGKKVTKVIQRDSEEYYDGSLILLLENNLMIEHQTTNGDQLFINKYKAED